MNLELIFAYLFKKLCVFVSGCDQLFEEEALGWNDWCVVNGFCLKF